jgi:ABC-type polysaccharide/polyol phosphate transport system ATPase subunit
MYTVEFDRVHKVYQRHKGAKFLRQHLSDWFRRDLTHEFHALKDVSFHVSDGESLAIIGSNGAGKSTLLSLVAGLSQPELGTVRVRGKVSALLELGSGFHPDLTGRENARLNASLLGFSRKKTNELFEQMVEFSGIREFIDEPLRTYSSGMIMRLAFSVAVSIDPDILLIDEVLAVGDQAFQEKCFERVSELRAAGKSMLCVSHSPIMLKKLCDRAIWLDRGEMVLEGSVDEVLSAYSGRDSGVRA